ncbi:MAG: transcription antitermination factor NusB [Bacteroidales bacterium]|nr:transcription antitermination factor NusB [Bacteroidales bacterium]
MINRVLIRLKIIQLIYAFYQNGNKNIDSAEKELLFSLSKAYDLYNYLLALMVAIKDYAERRIEVGKKKRIQTEEDKNPNTRFVDNMFIAQLQTNKQLNEFVGNQKRNWVDDDEAFIKEIYDQIIESNLYKLYMVEENPTYETDREFWRKLYKTFIYNNESLDQLLEEQSLYWNDDKEIVDTFVLKTIKRFDPKNGTDQELLPEYKDEEDLEFARRLFRTSIMNADEYRQLINESIKNWDIKRIAFMDMVVMQCAIAELINFPNIPINVTMNEYLEIAKYYSTPKSTGFINGTLDAIIKRLQKQSLLAKK